MGSIFFFPEWFHINPWLYCLRRCCLLLGCAGLSAPKTLENMPPVWGNFPGYSSMLPSLPPGLCQKHFFLSSCLCRLELLRLQPQTPSTRLWLRSECQPTDASESIPAELASETFSSLRQLHWSCELPVPSTSVPARATVLKLEQLFLHWDQLCNLGDLPSYVASLPHS